MFVPWLRVTACCVFLVWGCFKAVVTAALSERSPWGPVIIAMAAIWIVKPDKEAIDAMMAEAQQAKSIADDALKR